jgi:hypothetical protein
MFWGFGFVRDFVFPLTPRGTGESLDAHSGAFLATAVNLHI